MVLTIKNFESQNVGPGVVETAPTNLVGVAGTLKATLTWTSATGESGVTWTEEKLVRKEGSAPQGSMDGTTVATITTKDTYSSTGYEDTGLDSTKTYYYKVFAIYDNGTERGSTDVNVTPLSATLITTPGIYHNPTEGWISMSSDGTNWTTIADKNIGATSYDVTSTASYGDYFSWGALQNRNGQVATGYTMQQDWSTGSQSIAPTGYKIPSQGEWTNIVGELASVLGRTNLNYNDAMAYLLLPRSGQMLESETTPSYTETSGGGYYWTSTKSGTTSAFLLRSTVNLLNSTGSAIAHPRGLTVRCMKKTAVQPREGNEWEVLAVPPTPAGIYHNATLGLITLSDGNGNEITISDKNLGATQVYNEGDTCTDINSGKFFQWGNNYGFPRTGSITISNTPVDASGYGPNNYYSSSSFITRNNTGWDTSNNRDLWGGVTNTLVARRGPCDTGYHIPSKTELENIITIMTSLGLDIYDPTSIEKYLKMPHCGMRLNTSGSRADGVGAIWSSDSSSSLNWSAWNFGDEYMGIYGGEGDRTMGINIRPFKNKVVQPDNTWTKL